MDTDEEAIDDVEEILLEEAMNESEDTLQPAPQPESGYTFMVP